MNGLIVYKGVYGATQQYAKWLAADLSLPIETPEQITQEQIAKADYLVIGTSVYFGKFKIREWLHQHEKELSRKKLYLFVVNASAPNETEKREAFVRDNVPEEIRSHCEIFFLPGRVIHKDLSLNHKMALYFATAFVKNKRKKAALRSDLDGVRKMHITALIDSVKAYRRANRPAVTY